MTLRKRDARAPRPRRATITAGIAAIAAALCVLALSAGCGNRHTYTRYEPVYMSWTELRSKGGVESPRPLVHPGKIYLFGELIFLNEINEGVHVIDVEDPGDPRAIAFIEAPGAVDMAVLSHGGSTYLYVDSYVDLLVFDVTTDPTQFDAVLVHRIEDVFRYEPMQRFATTDEPVWFSGYDQGKGVIVDYTTEEVSERHWFTPLYMEDYAATADGSGSSAGVGGSMARFTLYQDSPVDHWYLYAVGHEDLYVFDLDDAARPIRQARLSVGWGIETIYPFAEHLFLGSMSAMYIYSLDDPAGPTETGVFEHWTSFDPVVVGPVGATDRNTAFVTLRSENGFGTDELIAVDVVDLAEPTELARRDLWNPHGLAFFECEGEERLIVADGEAGMKVFDVSRVQDSAATDAEALRQLGAVDNDLDTYDLIVSGSMVIVVGGDGLHLYSYAESPTDGSPSLQLHASVPAR